jgi:hypothetical protein
MVAAIAVAAIGLTAFGCGEGDGSGDVPLARPAADLPGKCRYAADWLGFAVPCPTRLPRTESGERAGCPGPCVAAPRFRIEVQYADISYLVIDARRARIVEACIGGNRLGRIDAFGRDVPLCYEGARGMRATWERSGIRYDVSIDSDDADDTKRTLLEGVVSSIEFVGPERQL